jgi:hypothetical protein
MESATSGAPPLTRDLKRPTLDVAAQKDFLVSGRSTLQKLDDYIKACDGVVHLIGKATGKIPEPVAVKDLLARYPHFAERLPSLSDRLQQADPRFSYTQWEAYLAIYHERPIFIYRPVDFECDQITSPREDRFVYDTAEETSQHEHYRRICALGRDRGTFLNQERLSSLFSGTLSRFFRDWNPASTFLRPGFATPRRCLSVGTKN